MPKATKPNRAKRVTTTPDSKSPDAEIFAMGRRHDEIWAEWDRLRDEDPRAKGLCAEGIALTYRLLLHPARTDAGLTEKKRIVDLETIEIDSNHFLQQTGTDFLAIIYELDEERIAAAAEVTAQHFGELEPISCEYIDINKVQVGCTAKTGDSVTFTLSTDSMMHLTNLMVAIAQNFSARVLKDLRATEAAAG